MLECRNTASSSSATSRKSVASKYCPCEQKFSLNKMVLKRHVHRLQGFAYLHQLHFGACVMIYYKRYLSEITNCREIFPSIKL